MRGHRSPYTSTKMGSFRCNGCCQYFKKLTEVKKHLQMQHYNLLDACMFCDHCSELFVNKQSLDKHMFVHVEQVFQCLNCKKKFLTQHELEEHSNKPQKCKPKSKLKKLHSCPFGCGESYVSAQLWKHKKKCKNAPLSEPKGIYIT